MRPIVVLLLSGATRASGQDCSTVIAQLRNASVSISAEGTVKTTGEIRRARGTGVIVSADGFVLTNDHVIDFGNQVDSVKVSGAIGSSAALQMPMQVVDHEHTHDLALLKFMNTAVTYQAASVGDPTSRTGIPLCSFGYPLDQEFHASAGLLGVGSGPGGWWTVNIVTNPGESGAPVFDQTGRLLGLRVAGRDDAVGIYYMVPSNFAATLLGLVSKVPPTSPGEAPTAIARRFWEAVYRGDISAAYELMPAVRKVMSIAEFRKGVVLDLSQFAAPPITRDDESVFEVNGALTVTTISQFDELSRVREAMTLIRQDGVWTPWQMNVYPIDVPLGTSFQYVASAPSAMLKTVAELPEGERAKFVATAYEGKFNVPPGWQLVVEKVGDSAASRTCDVIAHEEGTGAPFVLHRVVDGCALRENTRVRVIGRVRTIDSRIHLEALRLWK